MIGQRDFQRRINRLGTRVGEEDMVKLGRHRRQPVRGFKGNGVALIEIVREIQRCRLFLNGFNNRFSIVTRVTAP